jgi:glycosyltransferase involved in cell wall biosynthesis
MLIREPVDVLVSRGTSAEGLCAMRARVRPVSWAVNWHHPPGLPLARRRRAILRAVLGRADAVLAVSSSQVDELVDLGADAAAITVIPNGTDFCPAPEQRAASRFELGLATDDVAALLVGRLEAQKRVDVFIDALSTAQARAPQLIGLVAGVGPDADALAEHADAVGIRMRFLGRRDDMPSVLSAVDILCMTSDVEAAPYAVLEAMASGLPVIATRVGSLPEVIVEHQTGILVAPGATGSIARALACLADDSSGRIRMGLAGRARQVAAFSADTMAGEYASAISALAAARLSH